MERQASWYMNSISRQRPRRVGNRYPQGENELAASTMRSTSRLTKILPCNHARALAGSFLGRWPRLRIDFIRLKANSICHRRRYNSSTAAAEKVSGSVVQTAKYWAAVQEAGLTFFCALLALRFNRCRTLRVAASLRLMAMSRPWIHSPPSCLIRVLHDCAFSTFN